uniref:Uncharacterized protein n=1 Tax=viral metagenome TaxID=1070528 RepID=A0A6C0D8F8_9ZZZZ
MSFFNSIAEWFNNTIIKATYDPAADALKQVYRQNVGQNLGMLQQTIGNIGGGLGNVITSIPGIGDATKAAYDALRNESEKLLENAKNMTPDQIAEKNDEMTRKYNEILAQAQADGISYEEELKKQGLQNENFSITDFFNEVFSNTLYIFLFVLIVTLGLLGSSLAANAAVTKPFWYKIYYMVYGFLLFPVPIIQGIFNYLNKKRLFYALWAPLYKGTSFGLFSYNAGITESSHYTSGSLIVNPTERSARAALMSRQASLRSTFEPTQVLQGTEV